MSSSGVLQSLIFQGAKSHCFNMKADITCVQYDSVPGTRYNLPV